jgi:autotransporter-associated beta strand protein
MKPTYRNPLLRNFVLAATISLFLGQAANAAPRTWTGGSGIWETGQQGGWDDVWADADTATFNGTDGTVTLQSAIAAGVPLNFTAGNYTLESNDSTERIITLGALGGINQGTNVTTTIGSKATITGANQWAVDGVNKAGNTFNIENGGKLSNTAGILTIRETTFNIKTGGVLDNNNSVVIGDTADGATLNVQGGTLTIPATGGTNLILGNGAVTSTVNAGITTGGAITFSNTGNTGGIRFGPAAQAVGTALTATFDLDGGTVTTNKVYEGTAGVGTVNSTFNFNGGTLKALKTNTTDFMAGLDAANVKSLGAKIDSAAFDILIAQNLLDGGGSGGLTKTGTGALTLSGTNAYTGTTAINEGSLTITSTAALPGWDTNGRYSVANGATLAVYNAITDGNIATLLGTTNFAAGASIGFDTTTANRAYSVAIADTAQGALGLTKLGANTLTLNQANSYSGPTTVANGVLNIQNASALGTTTGATTVATNARLELEGGITVSGEAITISGGGGSGFFNGALNSKSGVNKWTGNITIAGNDTRIGAQAGASIEVSGIIDSGVNNHLVTFRPADTTATVIVSGNNTYVGPTTLVGGLVTASSLNSVNGGTPLLPSSSFGAPTTPTTGIINFGAANGSGLRYVGGNETTDRVINLAGGAGLGGVLDQSGNGELKFTSAFTAAAGNKTLTLQGSTNGTGEIAGAIPNGASSAVISLVKSGTGTWTLSGTNSFTGTTAVNVGTLKLNYGAGGTDTSKLSDTAVLTLAGGTLELVGGANVTPEAVQSTSLTANTVSIVKGTPGGTVLQMNAITRNTGASIDFGASGIATTDTLNNANGILGTWATINGTDWAVNSTNAADGLITTPTYVNVDAQPGGSGSTVISNGSSNHVRISGNGTIPGNITLGTAPVIINTLIQGNTTQAAVIDPDSSTSDTLQVGAIMVGTNSKGLTIGTSPNDGFLTAATAGGDLLLRNNSLTELFTVNSVIANNTSASSVSKDGLGTVVLAGTNTYTGATNVIKGTLKAGSSTAFNNTATLAVLPGATFDLNGFDAKFVSMTSNTGTITTTGAGSGTDTLTISASNVDGVGNLVTDNGTRKIKLSFTSNGAGAYQATTNVNNTYSGGLILGNAMRAVVLTGTVGTPGAITNGPFGRGTITINGGTSVSNGAQIWFNTANRTLVNDVVVNGNAGNGNRGGSFRVTYPGSAISGNIDANAVDAHFGADGAVGTSLALTGKLTGLKGFRFFNSSGSNAWTATLNNSTGNPNDYAGNTTVDSSGVTLLLGAADQIPNGVGKGNLAVNNGTLDLAGYNETVNGLSGSTATGVIDNLTAANATNTLTIGDAIATGTTYSGTIKNTAGSLSLVKIGTAIQTLAGANTYTGTTTVNGGTLNLTGSLAAGSAVTVGGATATGTPSITGAGGTVNGTLAIAAAGGGAAGTVSPGTVGTTGTLNAGATTIAGTYACDVTASACDLLAVNGALTLTGATLAITAVSPAATSYTIATYTGATPSFTTVTGMPSGYSLDYTTNGVIKLSKSGYSSWATTNNVLLGETGDDDKDGIINLVEYALGLNPQASNPSPGTLTGNLLSFNKGAEAVTAGDVTYAIETSTTLAAGSWTTVTPDVNDSSVISYTLPTGVGGKIFGRLKIVKP